MRKILVAMAVLAASPAAAAPSQLDTAIAKAEQAMGGIENIHALKSLVLRGSHYEGAYRPAFDSKVGDARMLRMQPNLRLVGCRPGIPGCADWSRIVETWDGSHGWELNWPKQRLIHTVNLAQQAIKCGAEFLPLFVDYKQRGFTATWLGTQTMLGKKTVALRVDQKGCSSQTYYFDPVTYDMEMSQDVVPVHARGHLRPTVTVYSNFKTVQGVKWPATSQNVELATGDVLDGVNWTSMEGNTVSDRALFEAPVTHPVGATALSLDMLAAEQAHKGTAAIMALYDRFRATPEGAKTDMAEDMHWVGYEFLKVNDFEPAFALFNRMVAENPKSDLFYDSLGDAYVQKGDRKAAAKAYDKALKLNPKAETTKLKRDKLAAREQ